jgi:hypothetical protein
MRTGIHLSDIADRPLAHIAAGAVPYDAAGQRSAHGPPRDGAARPCEPRAHPTKTQTSHHGHRSVWGRARVQQAQVQARGVRGQGSPMRISCAGESVRVGDWAWEGWASPARARERARGADEPSPPSREGRRRAAAIVEIAGAHGSESPACPRRGSFDRRGRRVCAWRAQHTSAREGEAALRSARASPPASRARRRAY